jgi:hypothetical protein
MDSLRTANCGVCHERREGATVVLFLAWLMTDLCPGCTTLLYRLFVLSQHTMTPNAFRSAPTRLQHERLNCHGSMMENITWRLIRFQETVIIFRPIILSFFLFLLILFPHAGRFSLCSPSSRAAFLFLFSYLI